MITARKLLTVLTEAPNSKYVIVSPPKFAWMHPHSCQMCGHEELKHPVFLNDGATTFAVGSRCAALALYGRDDQATQRDVIKQADRITYESKLQERQEEDRKKAYAQALAEFESKKGQTNPIPNSKTLEQIRMTYARLGGFDKLGKFPDWMARVAKTGKIQ